MKVLQILLAVVFTALVLIPAMAGATTIYLENGEEIQALSAWEAGDKVYVLRNKDILLEFDKAEVNLSKTRRLKKGQAPVNRKIENPPKPKEEPAPKEESVPKGEPATVPDKPVSAEEAPQTNPSTTEK